MNTFSYYPAPAKLNLMLHITGRRQDGYHNLQTVFQFLDYCDQIGFKSRDDGQIRRVNSVNNVSEDQDLVVRAARLLAAKMNDCPGVDLSVNKRIPMGGGLGGGSSDAATTLVALNMLWSLGLDKKNLMDMGLSLGADVPIFIAGHAAWAEGVGEELIDIQLPEPWFVVIDPHCHVSTAEIFSHSDLTRNSPVTTIADFLSGGGRNDCENLVRKIYPEVDAALNWLARFAAPAMTGTGGCVFASFDNEADALAVLKKLPENFSGFVAQGVNKSPLYNEA